MNLALFAYNFPHKKTQDFLFRLMVENLKPTLVLAANSINLGIPQSTIRTKPKHLDLIHPSHVCESFGIEYFVVDHNSEACSSLLHEYKISIALISGARILKENIINSVTKGIINIHPGLLPDIRGLDALLWSIVEEKPIGITAHVINKKIDHGLIIKKVVIPEYPDDTLIDLGLRIEETQNNIICDVIREFDTSLLGSFETVPDNSKLHRKMPPEIELTIPEKYAARLKMLGARR